MNRLGKPNRIFLGYYVPYDTTSWASLEANADQIDYVATQTVFVDACGNFSTQDNRTLHAFAKSRGIGVLPSVFTLNAEVNHKLLTDEATTARAIRFLVDYVVEEDYAGLDIDLEELNPSDRDALTSFVRRLSEELRPRGKLLTMAVDPKTSDNRTGRTGVYDYPALGRYVDLLTVMSYTYSWATSAPGSTAPLSWLERVVGYSVSSVPPEKVLMGVGFWGYDWNLTTGGRARALIYPQSDWLAKQYGAQIGIDPVSRSATFSYVARPGDPLVPEMRPPPLRHEVVRREPPPCPASAPTRVPPSPTATPTTEHRHVVWLENADSIIPRLQLARRHGTGGIAAWRLGQEDPRVWKRIAAWRAGEEP